MNKTKKKLAQKKEINRRQTHPQIIITALAALGFIVLAFMVHPLLILPAILLWWMNKRYIKKHLLD